MSGARTGESVPEIPTKTGLLVKRLALEFDKKANPALQAYGLTGAQYKLLRYLYANKDVPVRQVDLERFHSLTHPTAIGLLTALENKGFVERRRNPEDGRSRLVSATEKALKLEPALRKLGDDIDAELTAPLTPEEHEQLVALLRKLMTQYV